ncbi:hypothetical protein DXG03_002472 [Asterophora parasitica]|uniref:RanBP2-type domain-containing protein n=1 Tax=Asterophora parasitica TaxID=117018 RepID=A0A9P7G4C8_9AGAR|nr:hypothetical protein DXG03_002472 [Asterophora parasitica]
MSAIRNSNSRKSRTTQLPYARPAPKKSSWSLTGFLSFLNPLRSRSSDEATSDRGSDDESFSSPGSPPAPSSTSVHQTIHTLYTNNHAPTQAILEAGLSLPGSKTYTVMNASHPVTNSAPTNDLKQVSAQLRQSLGSQGVEELVGLLKRGTEEPEPFRFSSSPSTPARGNSPFQSNSASVPFSFGSSAAQLSTPSPRKTLTRNPNGVYRWQGAGSAKTPRSKNRYSSPAFGPSRSTSDHLVLKDTEITRETPKTGAKRRRVGEAAQILSAAPTWSSSTLSQDTVSQPPARATAPDPSPTRAKQALQFPISAGSPATPRTSTSGSSSNVNTSPSSSRLRPPVPQKPTVPVVPSPLRQAWSGASPPSNSEPPITPPALKQTKAANFMTELIKEVTPPKRPDLSNPYQTASPIGKVGPPKTRAKRPRATGRPAVPAAAKEGKKEKEKVYSPQAIIEATVPKGSKRSRPPAHFEKPSAERPSTEERRAAYVVEEVDAEDDEETKRATKKSKPHLVGLGAASANGRAAVKAKSPEIIVEEVDDVVMLNEAPRKFQPVTASSSTTPPNTSNSAPSASPFGKPAFAGLKSKSAPKEPSKLRFSYQPEASSPAPSPPATLPSASAPTPFAFPSSSPAPSTPVPAPFAFPASSPAPSAFAPAPLTLNKPATPSAPASIKETPKAAKEAAIAVPAHSLPTFAFSVLVSLPTASTSQHVKARDEAKSLPKSSLPSFDFSKQVRSAPQPSTSLPPVKAFDWAAAAGGKPVSALAEAKWECSVCMLSWPDSVADKCGACETPRPSKISAAPVVKGFDWAAAGMKPPGAASDWTCSTCMISNKPSVTKCAACESPR